MLEDVSGSALRPFVDFIYGQPNIVATPEDLICLSRLADKY